MQLCQNLGTSFFNSDFYNHGTEMEKELTNLTESVEKDVNYLNTKIEREVLSLNERIESEVMRLNTSMESEMVRLTARMDRQVSCLNQRLDKQVANMTYAQKTLSSVKLLAAWPRENYQCKSSGSRRLPKDCPNSIFLLEVCKWSVSMRLSGFIE